MTTTAPPPVAVTGRRTSRRRLLAALSLAGAVGALVASIAFAVAGLQTTGVGTGSAATGSVNIGAPVSAPCTVTHMVPGDDSTNYYPQQSGRTDTPYASCEYQVTYTGSLPAYIGLGTSFSGTQPPGTLAGQLQWQISESTGASPTDTQPGPYTTSGVINTNNSMDPLYVASDAGGDSTVYTFYVDYALPSTSPDSYRGLTATLTLTVYAVQSQGNGYATTNGLLSGMACTPGQQCAGIGAWS